MSFFRAGIAKGLNRIDRKGRVINGYAVITRGEALGHGLWIDKDMLSAVVKAGNESSNGVKCRFTHPGLCADGLGKYLGRAKNFSLDGDIVRADLCISDVADGSPDGKLGAYVMDLAEKDPAAFGTSIVFARDTDSERAFVEANGGHFQVDEYGLEYAVDFESPDPLNVSNYRHARLADLQASDVVDEPAANAGGFFGRADELAARGDAVLSFVLGLSKTPPDALSMGGMDPARAKAFVKGFLQRRKLEIKGEAVMPKTTKKLSDEDDEKKTAKAEAPPEPPADEDDEDEDDEEEEVAASKPAKKRASSMGRLAALKDAFPGRSDFVIDQFEKGHSVAQARAEFSALRVKELEAENAKLKSGAAPVKFTGENPGTGGGGDFMGEAKALASEKGITLGKAIRQLTAERPDLHAEFVASQKPKKTK